MPLGNFQMASLAGCRKCDLSEPDFHLALLDNIVYLSAQACKHLGVGVIHGSSQAPMTDTLGSMSNGLKGSLKKKKDRLGFPFIATK